MERTTETKLEITIRVLGKRVLIAIDGEVYVLSAKDATDIALDLERASTVAYQAE